ncbi:MAG: O-antigen ligase family protein [Halomonas sp.]|nr:O-antigen ligase [Halomonas sp.]TVP44944.1 MAG: O-antigen ligase family protein [Halomonas sp.]
MVASSLSTNGPVISKLSWLSNLAVFLLGAISLVVPSGYSVGAVILFLAGVGLMVAQRSPQLTAQDRWIIASLLAYAAVNIAEAWWDAQGIRGIDSPIRFIFAIPALLWVMIYPPRLVFLWGGFGVGAILSGIWAGWQRVVENVERAEGHTHVIQFGNLSMLLGVFCLAGLGWAMVQQHRKAWVGFLLVGAIAGILGSLLSGSRGGWVGFPIVLWVLYRAYGKNITIKLKGAILLLVLIGGSAIYMIPQIGVQDRIHQAANDISSYFSGEHVLSSVGSRFEMWRGAGHMILEKPITGWGENGYRDQMEVLASQGVVDQGITHYSHAHNEFIDTFAKRGGIGLLVLMILYLVPLRLFMRSFAEPDLEKRSVAVAGALLPVAYIDFGLTQAFLTHHSGTMMYAFLLAVLWGIHSTHRRQSQPTT